MQTGVKISALANRTLNQKLNDINKIINNSGENSEGITITNLYTDF